MDAISAFALASSIAQFLSFGLDLFARSRKIYKSAQGALPENIDAGIIVRDLLKHVDSLKAHAAVAGPDIDEQLKQLSESCTAVAEELVSVLERARLKEKGKKWATFKVALMSVWTKPQIEALRARLDGYRMRLDVVMQELQLRGINWLKDGCVQSTKATNALQHEVKDLAAVIQMVAEDVRTIKSLPSQRPKELGYVWETGAPENHVRVDDGLESIFYLPLDLCSSLEVFKSTLELKYSSRRLPGLHQVQSGHFVIFDWSEKVVLYLDNWSSLVKKGRGIKLAFVMGTWHGMPQNKCLRCFKPRKQVGNRRFQICHSCGLQVERVEPDIFPFEPQDISIGMGPDTYRDYLLKSRSKRPIHRGKRELNTPTQGSKPSESTIKSKDGIPPIDLVCRRFIVKWEPAMNIVHRYAHCRCVIRLSTPNRLYEEMTFLVVAVCPRHNIFGETHLDYGNMDYHQDPYFDRYGGYDCFRAMAYLTPNFYQLLGEEKFLPQRDIDMALHALQLHEKANPGSFGNSIHEYAVEINLRLQRNGFDLPAEVVEHLEAQKIRGKKEIKIKNGSESGFLSTEFSQSQRESIRNSAMMREVRQILDGKWFGKPHWAID